MKRERKRFEYQARDKASVQRRATQSGGMYDSPYRSDFVLWKPKEGNNRVRFLPATWEKPRHFGIDVWIHYGVGSDRQAYLCLEKMKGQSCPCCEQRKRAEKAGDDDYVRELAASKRVLVWIVDRDNEEAGPQLWSMPWTIDRNLNVLSTDEQTKETLFLEGSPRKRFSDGYDASFTRTGSGLKTKYGAEKVARKSSPLADDEEVAEGWLAFIEDNPLPDVLQYYDVEHIAAVAAGRAKDEDEDEDEDEDDRSAKRGCERASLADTKRSRDEEDEDEEKLRKPAKPRKRLEPDDDDEAPFDDDEDEKEKEPPKKAGKVRRRKPEPDDDDEEDEDED